MRSLWYDPWGAVAIDSGGQSVRYKYTGQEQDNTWFYDYHARLYDPAPGRFLSADTIVPQPGNPQSLYAYTLNNPVKYTDPTGHAADAGGASCNDCWEELYYAYDRVCQTVDPKAYRGHLQEYLAAQAVLYYNLWKEGPDSPNTRAAEVHLEDYRMRLTNNGYYGVEAAVGSAWDAGAVTGLAVALGVVGTYQEGRWWRK